mmetsp:Transcript_30363/g.5491  ORF Transcript_30363/g.5491 Transcript_30363/m.5491 type:complete len:81 (+) Transcript_30363:180-422(+)
MIIKTIISCEDNITEQNRRLNIQKNCFDLLGFDVIIDANLKPWLLEVNLSPSLSADSSLDFHIKTNLISDTFNLVGIKER